MPLIISTTISVFLLFSGGQCPLTVRAQLFVFVTRLFLLGIVTAFVIIPFPAARRRGQYEHGCLYLLRILIVLGIVTFPNSIRPSLLPGEKVARRQP